jgi:predicted permease
MGLRFAIRGLLRAPAFSAAAVVILAIGIAAATVMFALVRGVLLRPLPVRDQGRLVVVWKSMGPGGISHHPFGAVDIERVGAASRLLAGVAGVDANGVGREVINEAGSAAEIDTALVTGSYFQVLGVDPVLGRVLAPEDDVDGAEPVVVISHGLWRRRFAEAHDVVGRRLTIGETRFTIVGVMPPDVGYPAGAEVWRTTHSVPADGPFGDAARREIDLVGRLRPGVTLEQATAELTALGRRLDEQAPAGVTRGLAPVVSSFADVVVGESRPGILALMAAVALVLLTASVNVANLLLLRSEGRRAELAVHDALGAGRRRIVQLLAAEAALLVSIGAAAGLVVAWVGLSAVLPLLPAGLPRLEAIRIDSSVVAFVIAVAIASSVITGLVPAIVVGRRDLLDALRSAGRSMSSTPARRVRRALIVTQIALAVTLLAAAGLLARSLLRLQFVPTGFAGDRLLFVELAVPASRLADRDRHAQFLDEVVRRLEVQRPIAGATPVNAEPFAGDGGWDVPTFTAEGQSATEVTTNPSLNLEAVHPNYFATLGIVLTRGRPFSSSDIRGGLEVAVVSADVAARLWPGENPVGKRLKFGGPASTDSWRTVVGVAGPTRYRELAVARPTLYLPAAQFLETAQRLVVKSTATLSTVTALTRAEVSAVDPAIQVVSVAPFSRMLSRPLARPRFNASVASFFAAAALMLASIGLYAVVGAFVRHRDREIAVRVALGATPSSIRGLVIGEVLRLIALGAALGVAVALGVGRFVTSMMPGVDSIDPAALIGSVALLLLAAALASYWPVRQATKVDPIATLRQ